MDQRTLFERVVNEAIHIEEQAIESATKCVRALLEAPPRASYTGLIREMLATHLFVIAGVLHGRSTMDFARVEDPLGQIYALEPWKFGLKVREALFEIVTNTTLHPPSFVALLELITPCQAEILESQRRGARAFPQEEQLLARTMEAAFNYLHFTSEAEVRDRGFRDILESWQNHANPDIRELIARIQDDFLS